MAPSLSIALAQINPTVGDIAGNSAKILEYYERAKAQGAQLVVFPELSLVGYPPEDLVLMPSFITQAMGAVYQIVAKTSDGPALLIGSPWEENTSPSPASGGGRGGGESVHQSNPLPNPSPEAGEGIRKNSKVFNSALLISGGKISYVKHKESLPNYGIFDEKRIFSTGKPPQVVECCGIKLGILICEDVWNGKQAAALKKQGAELVVVINASPFEIEKLARRKAVAAEAVALCGVPLVYVNTVGGQDDIVFDGGSFVMDENGAIVLQMAEFKEALDIVILNEMKDLCKDPSRALGMTEKETLWNAMCLGLGDYVRKNGFAGVLLGLSGGIDSALTAALAVDALGADKVRGVLLPSPYTSQASIDDALELAKNLGIRTDTIPISPAMGTMQSTLNPVFSSPPPGRGRLGGGQVTDTFLAADPHPNLPPSRGKESSWMQDVSIGGNLQARLRGLTLMALSNQSGFMLLSTGNKSEIAVGYTTLYGDSCGGYNVLKDVYKTQVYALANWRNSLPLRGRAGGGPLVENTVSNNAPLLTSPLRGEGLSVIPERSITKAPTAELAPGQKDEDHLPPYETLDKMLALHLEGRMSAQEISAQGFDPAVVEKIVKMVRSSEYKRRQSCPGVKLSPMLFGKDRRFPLTNKF